MNEHAGNKPVELSEEEAKQVSGGATAVEYQLTAAVIGTAIIAGVTTLGQKLGTTFTSVQNKLK
jgi:pilus assembly protein Flp/PilA